MMNFGSSAISNTGRNEDEYDMVTDTLLRLAETLGDDPWGCIAKLLLGCTWAASMLPEWLPPKSGVYMATMYHINVQTGSAARVRDESVYPSYRKWAIADAALAAFALAVLVYNVATRVRSRWSAIVRLVGAILTSMACNVAHGWVYANALRFIELDHGRKVQDGSHFIVLAFAVGAYSLLCFTLTSETEVELRRLDQQMRRMTDDNRTDRDDMLAEIAELHSDLLAQRSVIESLGDLLTRRHAPAQILQE